MKKEQRKVVTLLVLSVAVIALFTALALLPEKKAGGGQHKKPSVTPAPTGRAEASVSEKAMIVSVDPEGKTITYRSFADGKEKSAAYTTVTEIADKYGKVLVAESLKFGEIVDITSAEETGRLLSVARSSSHWEFKSLDEYGINLSENKLLVRGTTYRITERTAAYQNGAFISPEAIKSADRLRVCGEGQEVLVLEVTKGHGYIRLENEEGLIGGTISFGGEEHPIEAGAVYVVRAGSYQAVLQKGEEASVADITVEENMTVTIDALEYGGAVPEKGLLWFAVEPFGAKLYIDGKDTYYYETEVELEYGTYKIEVSLGGYISYEGKITVSRPYQNYSFRLMENPEAPGNGEEGGGENAGPGNEGGTGNGETSDRETVSVAEKFDFHFDKAHKTYILKPTGAKVYIDGVYIGTAPLEFEKILDPYTITLQDGERQKSYTITPDDNGEDSPYSFPDL